MSYSITLKILTKKYGDKIIFDNVTLCFDNEHIYIINGENGCGKSTLLNILSKYDTDYMGSYECGNFKIGYLLQEDLLFRNLTVRENLELQLNALKLDDKDNKIFDIANELGLIELLDHKIYELSGGEKKKVSIAQIILTDADIILLDEPTANIQKEYANTLVETIYSEFENKILIIATHDKLHRVNNKCFVNIKLKDGVAEYGV